MNIYIGDKGHKNENSRPLAKPEDEDPDPARQEYPALRTFLALMMEDQVGEPLGL